MNYQLLKTLCAIRATSGDESAMTQFVTDYLHKHQHTWKQQPKTYQFQDCMVWVFGKPRTAVFTHLDSIGFTVGYDNHLIPIGSPCNYQDTIVVGSDTQGEVEGTLDWQGDNLVLKTNRMVERNTPLTFKPLWEETEEAVKCCYMDNRAGAWISLQLCETLEDGILVFSCYEEHRGGTVGFLADFIQKEYGIQQALICDITWCTSGVQAGNGVALSMRDSGIPRRSFTNKIVQLAKQSNIPFQIEVESAGGSDGSEIQRSPILMDWCFVGAPEENVHDFNETVHKKDLESMLAMYQHLMKML